MTKQTIQVTQETKDDFEKQRFKLKLHLKRLVTQDEFTKLLLKEYKSIIIK